MITQMCSFLKSVPPLPVIFTHPLLETLHPSVPPSWISIHSMPSIHSSISSCLSFYLSIPPLFPFPSSLLHFLTSKSPNYFPHTTLPSAHLYASSWVPPCLSLCEPWEAADSNDLCALAASPSTQQPLLLFNVTGPSLFTAEQCSLLNVEICLLQMIFFLPATIEAPQRKHRLTRFVLPYHDSCSSAKPL